MKQFLTIFVILLLITVFSIWMIAEPNLLLFPERVLFWRIVSVSIVIITAFLMLLFATAVIIISRDIVTDWVKNEQRLETRR